MRRRSGAVLPAALAAVLAAGCSGSTSDPGDDITDGVPVPGFVLEPSGASISLDGARVAVPCHDRICVWGIGGSLEAEVEGGAATAWSAVELDSGPVLVSGGDGEVSVVEVASGVAMSTIEVPGRVRVIAAAPEGLPLAFGTDEAVVLLSGMQEIAGAAVDLAFSPDGDRLAVAREQGPVEVVRVRDLRVLGTLGEEPARQVAWSPDGGQVAAGGDGGTRVFSASDLSEVAALPEPAAADLAFQPGGTTLAVADADDAALVLWEPTSEETTVLEGHSSPSGRVLWGSASSLYSVAPDAVLAWNLETGDLASTFDLPPAQ